jgi:DNA-binding transcriptional MocR family regulator
MASADAPSQQLLDVLAHAAEELGVSLACVGEAYEQLDDQQAERLEADVFHPLQRAYGRAKRAYAALLARHAPGGRELHEAPAPAPGEGAKALIERAIAAAEQVDAELADLQDSLVLVELGDQELRGALAEVRRSLDGVPARGHGLLRTFGR